MAYAEGVRTQWHENRDLYDKLGKDLHDKISRQKERVQEEFDSVNEKGDTNERKGVALENQVKNMDMNIQGVLTTIAITDVDMKETVDIVEMLGTEAAELEVKLFTTT
jgi:chromosome segregation ATPase